MGHKMRHYLAISLNLKLIYGLKFWIKLYQETSLLISNILLMLLLKGFSLREGLDPLFKLTI